MGSGVKTARLRIGGMTCVNCQNKIEKKLRCTAGILSAGVSCGSGNAYITYDADIISLRDIRTVIEKQGYKVIADAGRGPRGAGRVIGLLIIIAALYMLLRQFGILNLLVPGRLAQTNMGYGMLFVVGLLTSVHCIAMCGGINLSQCISQDGKCGAEGRKAALWPTFLYNLGRVISYTAVGFIVGALGSAVTFSNAMQGILKLIAGIFMVIMGVNMLGIFPWIRRLLPGMPKTLARKIDVEKGRSKRPLIVGLLNGIMPCGPLQAMQIYALSTGSPLAGALSMFIFSLGTVPLMFGLGALSTLLSRRFAHKVMAAGAVIVVVLGLSMFSQGWSLSGFSLPGIPPHRAVIQPGDSGAEISGGVQVVKSTLSSGRYPDITVRAGTPVKWIIDAPQGSINGCNNRMFIGEYGIEH
ncbi:MAG: heavy metal transporter, partial [Clostridiales bacterium]|nr:heavy metal transporter [Clostridiales bacterium]